MFGKDIFDTSIHFRRGLQAPTADNPSGLDDVLETVNGVTGQPHPLTATAQVLAVRPLHVYVPLLLLTGAASLRATLKKIIK